LTLDFLTLNLATSVLRRKILETLRPYYGQKIGIFLQNFDSEPDTHGSLYLYDIIGGNEIRIAQTSRMSHEMFTLQRTADDLMGALGPLVTLLWISLMELARMDLGSLLALLESLALMESLVSWNLALLESSGTLGTTPMIPPIYA